MKYDDASWHYGADNFPKELPESSGATHIGMFVAWAVLSGLAGELHIEESQESMRRLEQRSMTPTEFFLKECDWKFTDEDLNAEGNAFAAEYFDSPTNAYLSDYERLFGGQVSTLYHVADSWENYDLLKLVLDRRLNDWRAKKGS